MRTFGKLLQIVGLVMLPVAMYAEISGALGRSGGLSEMLLLAVFGIAAFMLGRYLEGFATR